MIKLLVRTVEHAKLDLQKKDSVVCARLMSPVYAVNTVGNVKTVLRNINMFYGKWNLFLTHLNFYVRPVLLEI